MSKETENKIEVQTFEQKKAILKSIVENYSMGFITATEMIFQIYSINWNEFEKSLIEQTFEKTLEFKYTEFKIFLGL